MPDYPHYRRSSVTLPPVSTRFVYRLGTSHRVAGAVLAAHGAAAVALVLNPVGAALLSWLMLGLAIHLIWVMRLIATRQSARAVVALSCGESLNMLVQRRDGYRFIAYPVGPVVIHPWLIVARMQPTGRGRLARFSLAIPGDACSPDAHRSLRVAIKLALLSADSHERS